MGKENPNRKCIVEDCDRGHKEHGYCGLHAQRVRKWGDPNYVPSRKTHETCTVEGCNRKYYGQGYCTLHYNRWKDHGTTDKRQAPAQTTCKMVEDGIPCGKPHAAKGLCEKHYKRYKIHGDPNIVPLS